MDKLSEQELLLLRGSRLLSGFNAETMDRFLKLIHRASYEPGETLLQEGGGNDRVQIIVSGTVNLFKTDKNKEQEQIGTLQSGQSLGEMQIVKNRPCTVTVKAAEPVVVLYVLLDDLRSEKNRDCYDAILDSVITVLNDRLSHGNESVVTQISAKKSKARQLFFALLLMVTFGVLLTEAGLAIYYATNTEDFCAKRSEVTGSETVKGHTQVW
ncbi:cyclic nucleotide-binding domain-containing protein [Legionella sp. CNM-4043-24]|uniref:cyclic nucleotide-binding domain-containing protein n=1 Tax=Legionella sp. CNM-4043-24 TaxID=3421646 RepID=UPI00403AA189